MDLQLACEWLLLFLGISVSFERKCEIYHVFYALTILWLYPATAKTPALDNQTIRTLTTLLALPLDLRALVTYRPENTI